jgi:hypothetical protein
MPPIKQKPRCRTGLSFLFSFFGYLLPDYPCTADADSRPFLL